MPYPIPMGTVNTATTHQRNQPARSSAPPANSSGSRLMQSSKLSNAGISSPRRRSSHRTRNAAYPSGSVGVRAAGVGSLDSRTPRRARLEDAVAGAPQPGQRQRPNRDEDAEGHRREGTQRGGGDRDDDLGRQRQHELPAHGF